MNTKIESATCAHSGKIVHFRRFDKKWGENPPHQVGVTYWDNYWRTTYKVTAISAGKITSEWADSTTTVHCTPLHGKDGVVVQSDLGRREGAD